MPEQPSSDSAEVARLQEELRREHDRLLRALADFDNFRKRVEREQAGAARKGKRDLIVPLLEVLDDFERAMAHLQQAPPAVAEGLASLHRKLTTVLAAEGVERFDAIGEPFDPHFHEAIGLVASRERPSGSIAEVLQHGYLWDKEVLRPARVRVAE